MPKYFQEEFDKSISLAKLIDQNWSDFLLPEEITSEFSSSWEKEIGYPCRNSAGSSRLSTSDSNYEGVPHADLAKAICTYPLFCELMSLKSLAKLTTERAGINSFKEDFQKQFYDGKTRQNEPVKNWGKIQQQIEDDLGGSEDREILKKFFTDSDSFHGMKGIGRETFTSSALCEAAGGMRKDSFYYAHEIASATNDSIYEKTKAYIEGFAASASSKEVKEAFQVICDFCGGYEETLLRSDPRIMPCKNALEVVRQWFHHEFCNYRGIEFTASKSEGAGNWPNVPWVTLLPPGMETKDGFYVSLCFGREGAGAVAGFGKSKTTSQERSLETVQRTKQHPLLINVDGSSSGTKYNNCFNNPLEFQKEKFDLKQVREHIADSLDLCIDFLGLEPEEEIKPYDLNDVLTDLFINESEIQSIKDSLGTKKNVVLQGPPGVGKTFVAQRLAYYLIGQEKEANIGMVQFHQSYSYEDFIQGYRPTERHFELKDGVFYRFCEKARERPDEKFVFIIDEINRGNLSKIFGEIMMLIEADKREEKYAVNLTYAENETDQFFVPENVHLLGLMNTADRSLAIVDYALRRRFRFFDIKPSFGESFKKHLSSMGVSPRLIDKICSKIETLNNFIREDHRNLGEGFMVGHSYFCDPPLSSEDHSKWLSDIFNYEIVPLINEYWIDNKEVKEKRTSDLLEGLR